MSQAPSVISKHPVLKATEDYYRLRREGIGFIEQMGSRYWTDYNLHDPGITLLEALCYALTEIGYRLGWDIKDLLMPADPGKDTQQPFFTARDILTVNPWTTDDFRRLLIDLDGIRNAWIFCKDCACDLHWHAWCDDDGQLQLGYQAPAQIPGKKITVEKVSPQGLYDVLLELESDPESGDLNDRKIEKTFRVQAGSAYLPVTIELRFPDRNLLNDADYELFMNSSSLIAEVKDVEIVRSKSDDTKIPDTPQGNETLRRYWRDLFFVNIKVKLTWVDENNNPQTQDILFENASMRLFASETAKNNVTIGHLEAELKNAGPAGFAWQYRSKLLKAEQQIAAAKQSLQAHRNLDEDYCSVGRIGVEEVAVCCDVEVAPDADIERVLALVLLEIEQYFNPPVHFYFLQELLDEGMAVEDIFQGPALKNGFIKAAELKAAGLKTELRVSDLYNRLMDIEGVVTVNNLLLTKYNAEGYPVKGAADLHAAVPNPEKISAEWTLAIAPLHQPRLYYNLSRFLFYKNGLPFLPRMDEVRDTLLQLRGASERPKIKTAANDLPVPPGRFRNPEDYFPVQYSLPLTYGIGEAGLPATATPRRRAQAKQLKAYLMPFEQILVNALAQVAHTADLFALDPAVQRTHFVRLIDEALIKGAGELFNNLSAAHLNDLVESETEFLERRNRFLDHLLARFGEQFKEYALLLTNLEGRQVALQDLIVDKIAFLKAYPVISHDRARAFNYTFRHPRDFSNIPGLQRRVSKLLGFPELLIDWEVQNDALTGGYLLKYSVRDELALHPFTGAYLLAATPVGQSEADHIGLGKYRLSCAIISRMTQAPAYSSGPDGAKFKITLSSNSGVTLLEYGPRFDTSAQADAKIPTLINLWNDAQRMIVVEHLLLRPKFPGDALYPACSDGPCKACGDADPYSFRLTFAMPGWIVPYNTNLDMRRFAERVARQETPAHLLPKVCWIGNSSYRADACDPVVDAIVRVLETEPGFATGNLCDCAFEILKRYTTVFESVYNGLKYQYLPPEVWKSKLEPALLAFWPAPLVCFTSPPSTNLQDTLHAMMLDYFTEIAVNGAQYSRFEAAWTAWLEANARFDWTEERLHDRVEAILKADIKLIAANVKPEVFCSCASEVLNSYGTVFYGWLEQKIDAGAPLEAVGAIPSVPAPVSCGGTELSAANKTAIQNLLINRYVGYVEVSYRLRVLLRLLAGLDNVYPTATLHDCDDGSDTNPVRLGSTGLGLLRNMADEALPEPPLPASPPPVIPAKMIAPEKGRLWLKSGKPKQTKAQAPPSRKAARKKPPTNDNDHSE